MATISSMMRLYDGFSTPVEKSISAMRRMVDAMERVNNVAQAPGMEQEFAGIRTEISLAEHGLDTFRSSLSDVKPAAQGVKAQVEGISKAIVVANQGLQLMRTLWGGVNRLGDFADQRISVDARMNLINDGGTDAAGLQSKVMAMANNSRADYAASAALVAKMGRQDVFAGNNDAAIQFTETLNKGLVISGASATEAAGALTQLSQGLASGVLRGDEFNSIMENAPVLAEMMTQSMGVTKGELREMAEDGLLSTDVVVSGIMAQADAIDQQFAQMPVTFGQAKTRMANHASDLMSTLSKPGMAVDVLIQKVQEFTVFLDTPQGMALMENIARGITFAVRCVGDLFDAFVNTYEFITDNWKWIGPIFQTLAIMIAGVTAATLIYNGVMAASALVHAIVAGAKAAFAVGTAAETAATGAATTAQLGLNAALLACPITWIIILVIALIAVFIALWDNCEGFRNFFVDMWAQHMKAIGEFYNGVWVPVANGVIDIQNQLMEAIRQFCVNVINWIADMAVGVVENFDWIADKVRGFIGLYNSIAGTFGQQTINADFVTSTDGINKIRDTALGQINSAFAGAKMQKFISVDLDKYNQIVDGMSDQARDFTVGGWIQEQLGLVFDELPGDDPFPPPTENDYGEEYKKLSGGMLDKIGQIGTPVDISSQSLMYLRDIAELSALNDLNTYATIAYQQTDELRLSQEDADALARGAGHDTNIYYLNYSGGAVTVTADMKKGEDWEAVKQRLHDEADEEISSGLSGIDEVVYPW